MRIKRSSSKKKKSHSNDSRDNKANKLRNSDEFDRRKTSIQNGNTISGHYTRYQGLSTKTQHNDNTEKLNWDKRFIECNTKARTYDLISKPDVSYLKKILETENDER